MKQISRREFLRSLGILAAAAALPALPAPNQIAKNDSGTLTLDVVMEARNSFMSSSGQAPNQIFMSSKVFSDVSKEFGLNADPNGKNKILGAEIIVSDYVDNDLVYFK